MFLDLDSPTLAFTTLRPTNRTSFDRRNPLMLVLLPIRLVDLCRLENSHGTAAAALFAPFAPPPVLADASAAALLAPAALPPVLADTGAAALLALAAPQPVLADTGAAALLAQVAILPVLTDPNAATVLATVAVPPVLTDTGAAAILAPVALLPVLALYDHSTFAQPVGRRLTNLDEVLPRDALVQRRVGVAHTN